MSFFFVFFTIRGTESLHLPTLPVLTSSRFQERWSFSLTSLFDLLFRSVLKEFFLCCLSCSCNNLADVCSCKTTLPSLRTTLKVNDVLIISSCEIIVRISLNFLDVENTLFGFSRRDGNWYSGVIQLNVLTSSSLRILYLSSK